MSKSRAKGTAAETAVVNWLKTHGFPYTERRAGNGTHDRGDIAGIPGVVLEVKNCRRDELPAWVDEATLEAANVDRDRTKSGAPLIAPTLGVVIHKRVGKGDPGAWFATMTVDTLAQLIR